jgi:hypothetical protein
MEETAAAQGFLHRIPFSLPKEKIRGIRVIEGERFYLSPRLVLTYDVDTAGN